MVVYFVGEFRTNHLDCVSNPERDACICIGLDLQYLAALVCCCFLKAFYLLVEDVPIFEGMQWSQAKSLLPFEMKSNESSRNYFEERYLSSFRLGWNEVLAEPLVLAYCCLDRAVTDHDVRHAGGRARSPQMHMCLVAQLIYSHPLRSDQLEKWRADALFLRVTTIISTGGYNR